MYTSLNWMFTQYICIMYSQLTICIQSDYVYQNILLGGIYASIDVKYILMSTNNVYK